jgi:hypothetical protein
MSANTRLFLGILALTIGATAVLLGALLVMWLSAQEAVGFPIIGGVALAAAATLGPLLTIVGIRLVTPAPPQVRFWRGGRASRQTH